MTALVPISLPSAGSISVESHSGALVLRMAGEIDAETVAAYERTRPLADAEAVDLAEVTFLSSSAVSFLIRRTQSTRESGRLPEIRALSLTARRVLELLGASRLFALA